VQLDVDVRGWRCLVVGAGPVGSRRALRLVDAGADVHVVAPEATDAIRLAASTGRLRWSPRPADPSDAEACRLLVLASGRPEVDSRVAEAAAPEALVNRAADAGAGDLRFPAVAVDDGVVVTVATPAGVPALSVWLADRLAPAVDSATGLDADGRRLVAGLLAELRAELSVAGAAPGVDWRSGLQRSMLDPVLSDLIRTGRRAEAKERLQACLSSS